MTSNSKKFVYYDLSDFSESHVNFSYKEVNLLEFDALDLDYQNKLKQQDVISSPRPTGPKIAIWYQKELLSKPCVLLLHGASIGHQNFFYPKTPGGKHDGKNWGCLVDFLIYHGFCPIVADWRSSMNVVEQIFEKNGNNLDKNQDFDAVAYEDIPAILCEIKNIRRDYFEEKQLELGDTLNIDVIGKCVGGGAISQFVASPEYDQFEAATNIKVQNLVIMSLGLFYQVGIDGYLKSQDGVLPQLLTSQSPQSVIDPHMSKKEIAIVNNISTLISDLMSFYNGNWVEEDGVWDMEIALFELAIIKIRYQKSHDDLITKTKAFDEANRTDASQKQDEYVKEFINRLNSSVEEFGNIKISTDLTGKSLEDEIKKQILNLLSTVQSHLSCIASANAQFVLNRWPRVINELYNNSGFLSRSFREKENDVPDELGISQTHEEREYFAYCNRLAFIYGNIGHDPAFVEDFHKNFMSKQFFGKMPTRILLHGARNTRRGWAARFNATKDSIYFRELINADARRRFGRYAKEEKQRDITLITGYWNRVWHRDSIDKMYEWLTSGPNALKRDKVSKHIFEEFGHYDLLWGERQYKSF